MSARAKVCGVASLGLLSVFCGFSAPPAAAQQLFNARDEVVRVRVAGVDANGADCIGYGSGFYISAEGEVLTSYHVVAEWLEHHCLPESMRLEVSENVDGPWMAALELARDERFDYMVWQIFVDGREKQYFRRSQDPRHAVTPLRTPIFTSGFPEADGYRAVRGQLTTFQGPPVPLERIWMWRSDLVSRDGLSGGPVYTENGEVIGIYRGDDEATPPEVYIVPITKVVYYLELPEAQVSIGRVLVTQRMTSGFTVETTQASANVRCSRDRRLRWDFTAPEGFVIDPQSFQISSRQQDGASRIVAIDSAGQTATESMSVDVRVANGGFCVWGLGRDQPGVLDVGVRYDVSRTEEVAAIEAEARSGALLVVGDAETPVTSVDLVSADGVTRTYARDQLLAGGPVRLEIIDGREVLRFN